MTQSYRARPLRNIPTFSITFQRLELFDEILVLHIHFEINILFTALRINNNYKS